MFFLCGLHNIVLEIDFKQNKSIMENFDILWWQKILVPNGPPRRTSRSPGRFIGRLGRLGDLLFYTLDYSLQSILHQTGLYLCCMCQILFHQELIPVIVFPWADNLFLIMFILVQ